jgi:hypothetical protein
VNLSGLEKRPPRVPQGTGVQGPGSLDMRGCPAMAGIHSAALIRSTSKPHFIGPNCIKMKQGGRVSYKHFRPVKMSVLSTSS